MYNLLIVDDEPIIRRGIKSIQSLSDIGIQHIFEAGEALAALDITEKENIHIVLLDINMPGIDGLSLAEMLKEKNKDINIIMISGYDYFEYMQKAIRIGVDDYILKPVNKRDVELIIKSSIDKIEKNKIKTYINELHTNSDLDIQNYGNFNIVDEYIKKHIFDKDFSLAVMADKLGFNANYLSGVIKQMYGTTFQDYVGLKRMEQAKILLLSRNLKNYEAANEVGYEDVNYFLTKFKKTYGITPKQFKQGEWKK